MDFLLQQYVHHHPLHMHTTHLPNHAQLHRRRRLLYRQQAAHRRLDGTLAAWCKVQQLYFPGLAAVRAVRARTEAALAEGVAAAPVYDIPLHLPSKMPPHIPVDPKFYRYEWQLRKAQAFDALATLRQQLCLRSHLLGYKFPFDRGQKQNLRSNNVISRVHVRTTQSTDRYRSAHEALITLEPKVEEVGWDGR